MSCQYLVAPPTLDRESGTKQGLQRMGICASRADKRRGRARVPLESLLQDLQLPALPEALPDAQLLEGGMSAPDSASVAKEDLSTSVKALLGPGKPILPSTQRHAWQHC